MQGFGSSARSRPTVDNDHLITPDERLRVAPTLPKILMATPDHTTVGAAPMRALLLPMRTVLLVAATAGVLAAFWAIGDTFLIVFIGIFLALVFEYPVRFVMQEDDACRAGWRRRSQ